MSGIAGLVLLDGALPTDDVAARMAARVAHRGPDSSGTWAEGKVALAHRGLRTTPESFFEDPPLAKGPFALVADVRVDDRDALASRLGKALATLGLPEDGRPLTDHDLLLAAYAEWGDACPDYVLGDYAFAVWDKRFDRLFCAVDAFGTRPFYYTHRPGALFAFGSQTRAVAEHVSGGVDEAFLADRLLVYRDDPVRTPIRDVWALPGGHALAVDPGGIRVWQTEQISPDPSVGAGWSDDDYIEGYRERFEQAVQDRTRSSFPVGAELSGGLDSSSVAAVARDIVEASGRGPVYTFSNVYSHVPVTDEREYIDAVLSQGGMISHLTEVGELNPYKSLDEVIGVVDDEIMQGAFFTMWASYKNASASGVRTLLTGVDGDTVVSHGMLRLRELAEAGEWAAFGRETRALQERYSGASHRQTFQELSTSATTLFLAYGLPALDVLAEEGRLRDLIRSLRGARRGVGADPKRIARRLWRRAFVPTPVLRAYRATRPPTPPAPRSVEEREVSLAQPFRNRKVVRDRLATIGARDPGRLYRTLREEHTAAVRYLAGSGVAAQVSLVAGAAGVEPAHPFLDRRLVEYSLALPPHMKLRDGWTRYVHRRAMDGVLPSSVAWRVGKANFAPAFAEAWFGSNLESVEDLLAHPGKASEVVDIDALRARVAEVGTGSDHLIGGAALGLAVVHWLRTRNRTGS